MGQLSRAYVTFQTGNGNRMPTKNVENASQLVSFIKFSSAVETSNLPYGSLGPVIVDSGQRKYF